MTIDWQFEQIEELREDEDLEGKLALANPLSWIMPLRKTIGA
jgi:hypothetical protein